MGKQSSLLEGRSQDLSELSQINSCGAVLRLKPGLLCVLGNSLTTVLCLWFQNEVCTGSPGCSVSILLRQGLDPLEMFEGFMVVGVCYVETTEL